MQVRHGYLEPLPRGRQLHTFSPLLRVDNTWRLAYLLSCYFFLCSCIVFTVWAGKGDSCTQTRLLA